MLSLLSLVWSKINKYVIAIGAALGIILGAYLKGQQDQKNRQTNKNYKDLKKGQEIDEKVRDMPLSDLDRNISRWLRD